MSSRGQTLQKKAISKNPKQAVNPAAVRASPVARPKGLAVTSPVTSQDVSTPEYTLAKFIAAEPYTAYRTPAPETGRQRRANWAI